MEERLGFFFVDGKTALFSLFCRFFPATTVFIAMTRDFIAMKTVVIPRDLGTSQQRRRSSWKSSAQLTDKSWKKIFGIYGSTSPLSVNIRFSGSWDLSYFSVLPVLADKTEPVTGQPAELISSGVKQKPSGLTKCKIKMNRNFRWNRKRAKKGLL